MKNLIFKEFKLAVHPICYIFVLLFPAMVFIPSYPLFIGFIYVASCYPILFLGANKGQQSNDLYYTALLPVRKKDIVLARLITVTILLAVSMIIVAVLAPIAQPIKDQIYSANPEEFQDMTSIGLGIDGLGSLFGFTMISMVIYDLIFFTMYYKNGKAIVLPTMLGIFIFCILESIFALALPYVNDGINDFLTSSTGNLSIFFGGLVFYILICYVIYKTSSKRLENVDL